VYNGKEYPLSIVFFDGESPMYTKMIRFWLSIILGVGLWVQVPGSGTIPAQAVAPIQLQWLEFGSYPGSAPNAQYGRALAESSNGNVFVVGAGSETVSGQAAQGAAYVFLKSSTGVSNAVALHASDGAAGDHFGASVAISGDGNTILVGANQSTVSGHIHQGAAYVFVRSGMIWNQQAKLSASSGAAGEFFGTSVALNNDGSTALIGAYGYTFSIKTAQGGAYVFTRSGTTWSQQTTPTPLMAFDAAANDWSGSAVSLSDNGNTALVAAPGKSSGRGAAYVYVRSGSSWAFQSKILAWDGVAGDDFARSVSLSGDGNLALISADNASPNGVASGAAYTFTRSGTLWSNGVKLIAPDGATGDWFGYSASLSKDGSTAVVGAVQAAISSSLNEGTAYVFYGPGFTQKQKLVPGNGQAAANIGAAVAIAGDGSSVVVGAPNWIASLMHVGTTYVFCRYASPWRQQYSANNLSGKSNDAFGDALALSSDGNTAIVGSVNMNTVFIYTRSGGLWSLQANIPSKDPNSNDFGASVALSGDGNLALVGALQAQVGTNGKQGAAYLLTRSGATWSVSPKIVASDGAANDQFGISVALSRDGTTAAIGAFGTNSSKGSVYTMTRSGGTWSALTRIQAADGATNDCFGNPLALSGDGSTLLVGAYNGSNGTTRTGVAYVFARSGGVYAQQTKFVPETGSDGSRFGLAVALSADGNSALVGAPYWGTGDIPGVTYFYVRSDGVWYLESGFVAVDHLPVDQFGSGVALSADGNTAVIGAQRAMMYGSGSQGAVYVYTRSVNSWNLQAKISGINAAQGENDGKEIAISGDGHTILFNADTKDSYRGGIYIFVDYPYAVFLPIMKR
jgi:hypothetical protein